jgi:hypothetical protein
MSIITIFPLWYIKQLLLPAEINVDELILLLAQSLTGRCLNIILKSTLSCVFVVVLKQDP